MMPPFRRTDELILPLPSHKSIENFSFWFFNDFIYRCRKLFEYWVGALVLYAADVAEGKRWTMLFLTDPWSFISLPLLFKTFDFLMSLFLFSLSKCFLTSSRRFSSLRHRRFGGLVICIAETTEYFVFRSFYELLVVSITDVFVIRRTHSQFVIRRCGGRSDFLSDV